MDELFIEDNTKKMNKIINDNNLNEKMYDVDDINEKMLQLLPPELYAKLLLNLLTKTYNCSFDKKCKSTTSELNKTFDLENNNNDKKINTDTINKECNDVKLKNEIIDNKVDNKINSLQENEIDLFFEKDNNDNLGTHLQHDPKEVEFLTQLVTTKNIKTIMEIGFNTGYSAYLFLKTSENISVISFDIATHSYVDIGKTYIDKKYPGRHTLIKGDSRKTVLNYFQQNSDKKFDLIFIHGGHYGNVPQMDLTNCRLFADKNTIVIMNDVKYKNIEAWNIKPNEAWSKFIEKNYIDELKQIEFSPLNGLVYGKYNLCEVYICSLLRPDRMTYIEKNQKLFPFIKTFKSVNGYNTNIPLKEIINLNLKYVDLDNNFRTYGTLANWITKYKMLKYQVENEIPFLCFLEDDLLLENIFYTYICDALIHFKTNVNILRLMNWGEGYITSYESAKRVLEHLERDGIKRNIDNQLRENCGYELLLKNAPIKLMIVGNTGDCLKTQKFTNIEINSKLQILNKKSKKF